MLDSCPPMVQAEEPLPFQYMIEGVESYHTYRPSPSELKQITLIGSLFSDSYMC